MRARCLVFNGADETGGHWKIFTRPIRETAIRFENYRTSSVTPTIAFRQEKQTRSLESNQIPRYRDVKFLSRSTILRIIVVCNPREHIVVIFLFRFREVFNSHNNYRDFIEYNTQTERIASWFVISIVCHCCDRLASWRARAVYKRT